MSFPIGRPFGKITRGKLRTFDDLETALTAGAVGDVATLWGPTDWVGHFMHVATGVVRAFGPIRLWAADSDTFTVGTDGSGSNIERFDTAAAPTWGTPGASTGGMILDGSGALIFPALGEFTAESLAASALTIPTIGTPGAGDGWGIGTAMNARAKMLGGGARYSGTDWYRGFMIMTTSPTITVSGADIANLEMQMVTLDPTLLSYYASKAGLDRGAYIAAAFRGNETPDAQQQNGSTNSVSIFASHVDQEVTLYANNITTRFSELAVHHMSL